MMKRSGPKKKTDGLATSQISQEKGKKLIKYEKPRNDVEEVLFSASNRTLITPVPPLPMMKIKKYYSNQANSKRKDVG